MYFRIRKRQKPPNGLTPVFGGFGAVSSPKTASHSTVPVGEVSSVRHLVWLEPILAERGSHGEAA